MDFVSRLLNRYNGGWSAAIRCVRHNFPDFDGSKVEAAHLRGDFELPVEGEVLDIGLTEADIANVDPRAEFAEDQGTVDAAARAEEQVVANTPIGTDKSEEPVAVIDGSEEEERTK